jgi:hypothetical protein
MKTQDFWKLIPLLALLAGGLLLAGCEGDDPASPEPTPPTLPAPDRISFDLDFFSDNAVGDKIEGHFINAAARVALINTFVHLLMAPPVAAFSLALHTVPSRQEDGSWIWVYTFVHGEDELQIRLRGLQVDEQVQWELRVSAPLHSTPIDNELWFSGVTGGYGRHGTWTFYDSGKDDRAVAALEWGEGPAGEFLILTSLHGDDEGDSLAYYSLAPLCSVVFSDVSDLAEWFVRWNEEDHTGSLQFPDYNRGEQACWDEELNNTDCEPVF